MLLFDSFIFLVFCAEDDMKIGAIGDLLLAKGTLLKVILKKKLPRNDQNLTGNIDYVQSFYVANKSIV